MHGKLSASTNNKLLELLPEPDLSFVSQHLQPTDLKVRQVLHYPRDAIEHVYFVESGLVSVLAEVGEKKFVEAWMIGCEGLVGATAILGRRASQHRRVVLAPGRAYRMRTADLHKCMAENRAFHELMAGHLDDVIFQTSQIGACNATHSVANRVSRWLLMACVSGVDAQVQTTHDAIGRLLGVRRATVSETLKTFQVDGLIEMSRGETRVCDPDGLADRACLCYRLMRSHRERFHARFHDAFGSPTRG